MNPANSLPSIAAVEPSAPESSALLPVRYEAREGPKGRYVRCREAPAIGVALDRSYAFSEAEARKLGERTILLDGAGQFGPLVDGGRHLYNLDHHSDCQRMFTLATCEQALILVLKNLELDKGDWTICANEPDLDTVLAIWVLLNHRRIKNLSAASREVLIPLLRLEGAIDANGFEIAEYCGLPAETLVRSRALIDQLFAREQAAKREGRWDSMDLVDYVCDMLVAIDLLIYDRADFDDYTSVDEEFGHVEIGNDKVAVVCRDASGIFDVEKRLKKVWGDRLGIVALLQRENVYTLRRTASLTAINLERAYRRLNLFDPAVDGRPPEKRWGGSDEIGGSPRPGGSGLQPREVVEQLRRAYQPVSRVRQLRAAGIALLLSALLAAIAWFAGNRYDALDAHVALGIARDAPLNQALQLASSLLALVICAALVSWGWVAGRLWRFGWRWPGGEDWPLLALPVLIGGVAGSTWLPRGVAFDADSLGAAALACLLGALASEISFRGLAHGLLVPESAHVQRAGEAWFISVPNGVGAVLYALVTGLATWLWLAPPPWTWAWLGAPVCAGLIALPTGLALGAVRERADSLLPGIALLVAACAVRLLIV
ncbi:MAG: hypothetical protein AAF772_08410 [Acidobacteriota bacterium]